MISFDPAEERQLLELTPCGRTDMRLEPIANPPKAIPGERKRNRLRDGGEAR